MCPSRRKLEVEVRLRADGKCEYCQFPDAASELPFHIDHIIALKHGGESDLQNLAWACFSCNLRKVTNIAGRDPETGELTPLYNPRLHVWSEHFVWDEVWLAGLTAIGRVTISVLDVNHPDSVAVREALNDERRLRG